MCFCAAFLLVKTCKLEKTCKNHLVKAEKMCDKGITVNSNLPTLVGKLQLHFLQIKSEVFVFIRKAFH